MLYSFYKWMFSIRGKKVVRLRHRLSRSKIFKQAPDSVLSGTRNLADSPKDLSRRILKAFRIFLLVSLIVAVIWIFERVFTPLTYTDSPILCAILDP